MADNSDGSWACSSCTFMNNSRARRCGVCDKRFDAEVSEGLLLSEKKSTPNKRRKSEFSSSASSSSKSHTSKDTIDTPKTILIKSYGGSCDKASRASIGNVKKNQEYDFFDEDGDDEGEGGVVEKTSMSSKQSAKDSPSPIKKKTLASSSKRSLKLKPKLSPPSDTLTEHENVDVNLPLQNAVIFIDVNLGEPKLPASKEISRHLGMFNVV